MFEFPLAVLHSATPSLEALRDAAPVFARHLIGPAVVVADTAKKTATAALRSWLDGYGVSAPLLAAMLAMSLARAGNALGQTRRLAFRRGR